MSDLLQVSDLERAKMHDTFHSEVITGKAGGLAGGADIEFAINAVTSQSQKTLPKILADIDWSYVGLFADGVTFTDKTDFAVDAVGTQWIYTGNYPFTATAGTVPSEPTYQAVHVKSASAISNANGGSVQDFIDAQYSTVAELATGKFQVGQYVRLVDRAIALFLLQSGGSADGNGVLDAGNSNTAIIQPFGVFIPEQWGVNISGIIPSDDAYVAVRDAADAAKSPLTVNGDIIKISSNLTAPKYGFKGSCKFTSGGVIVSRLRKSFQTSGGKTEIDESQTNVFHVSGSQYGSYNNIDNSLAGGFLIDGNAPDFGSFWNTFSDCIGNISINIGDEIGQAVNQNTFINHRGSLHIYGEKATELQQCDNNIFYGLDTTLGNITDPRDGSTGWHALNSSVDNSNNLLLGVYMEGAGKRAIKGNFSTIKTYSDGAGSPYATPQTCHHLMNGDHNLRNMNDHFSANPVSNLAIGGLWDILNADDKGQPLCLSDANVVDSVVADANIPMGFTHKYGGTSVIDFSLLKVKLSKSFSGAYGVCILLQNVQGNISMQFENDGVPKSMSTDVYHDLGNGWRLYRLSSLVRNDGNDDQLTIFFRTLGATAENYIAGVWATPQKTTFMVGPVPDVNKLGVSTSTTASVAITPIALPVGGRIKNINPLLTTGNTVEWVKRADNTSQPIITMS